MQRPPPCSRALSISSERPGPFTLTAGMRARARRCARAHRWGRPTFYHVSGVCTDSPSGGVDRAVPARWHALLVAGSVKTTAPDLRSRAREGWWTKAQGSC